MFNFLTSMHSDGQGNTSWMRVILTLFILAILIPKVVIAIHTGTSVVWSESDFEALGVVFGSKLIQNVQENTAPKP